MAIERSPQSYRNEAERVLCDRYQPCEIDGKCRVRAPHLFHKCQGCQVPPDNHNEKNRAMMIRRDPNFLIKSSQLSPETVEAFRELGRKHGS